MKWKEHEGKSSNELVDVLLTELAGSSAAEGGGAEYFEGLVSLYLNNPHSRYTYHI